MRIDVLSLFPNMFTPMRESIIGKTIERGLVDFKVTDFRDYTDNKHNKVDDEIYGGGQGMLLMPQPIFDAMDAIESEAGSRGRVILMDPAGKTFNQEMAEELAKEDHLTFIAGHYEGYDERIRDLVTDEISLGDFVLTVVNLVRWWSSMPRFVCWMKLWVIKCQPLMIHSQLACLSIHNTRVLLISVG